MKLRRKHAWLLTAPLAWLSGCGGGPISGLADREPVVSLQRPDPLLALRNSSTVEAGGADAGAFSTAERQLPSADPEGQRLFLLSSARRRMQQQQMMMQMMMPTMAQPPMHQSQGAVPAAPSRIGGTTTKPVSKSTPKPAPAAATPVMTPQMLLPGAMPLDATSLGGLAARRASRLQRPGAKLDRESNAASVEAERIERAAAAEAERAEKAAQAEASIAESRLLAEAEIVERMTRAETELAERLAAAKDERDRRISLAKEERELRLAILGVDPEELGTDPVQDALSKLDKSTNGSRSDDSGLTRFTRFFRSKPAAADGANQGTPRQVASRPAEAFPSSAGADPGNDLIDRTLNHSAELLDRPSIADFAATIPDVDGGESASVAAAPTRSGPENLHSSLFGDATDADDYDALLSRESLAKTETLERENWSLLDDFDSAGTAGRDSARAPETGSGARDFPAVAETPASSTTPGQSADTTGADAAQGSSVATAGRRVPEDDVWILGGERDLAGFDNLAPAGDAVVRNGSTDSDSSESFTTPGGLYADTQTPAPATTAEQFPADAAADPWVDRRTASAAEVPAREEAPLFDWSQSAASQSQVAAVAHQQPPAAQETIRNASWTTQSLRDACGPLPADLEALVVQLDIPEAGVRKDVLADLARLGTKARPALPAIRVLLEDSPLVAAHAAWTLWEIEQNESQTVQELVRLMHTGEPEVVQFTAYALGSLGPKALDAAPALRAERERLTGATRIHVAEALTRIDAFDQASVEVLIASLQHPETHVRWMAAIALGQTQVRYADLAVPALVGGLHDQDPEVRAAAALSIGGFGSAASGAVSELQSRATLDSPSVREAAQTALACIRTL